MAIFGKDNLTDLSEGTQSANLQITNKAFNSVAGDLQNIYYYTNDPLSIGPATIYAALYSHDGSNNKPENLLASGSAVLLLDADWQWLQIPMDNTYTVEADTTYWLSINTEVQFGRYRNVNYPAPDYIYSGENETAGIWINPWTADSDAKRMIALYGETLSAETETETFNSDSYVHDIETETFNSNSFVCSAESVTFNSNSFVYDKQTETVTSDARIIARGSIESEYTVPRRIQPNMRNTDITPQTGGQDDGGFRIF